MFGYVRPLRQALSEEEYARYQAAYCGLCHTIGARYGFVAQLFLNYDFAFLAMVLAGEEEKDGIHCRRCPVYVTRKRDTWDQNPSLELAADKSIILAYWKLRDSIADRRFLSKIPSAIAAFALGFSYRKAKKYQPGFDIAVREELAQLRQLELENCGFVDRPADHFARILQAAAAGTKQQSHALSQLLYHVGRWIYLIDAWDDLDEDIRQGSYNPFLACFGGKTQKAHEGVRETMYAYLGLVQEAAEWLSFGTWSPIVENIITLGLPAVEEAVLSGEWNSKKKQIIRRPDDE